MTRQPVVGGEGVIDHARPRVLEIRLLTVTGSGEVNAKRGNTAFGERPSFAQVHVADLVLVAGEPVQHQHRRVRAMAASRFRQRKDAGDLVIACRDPHEGFRDLCIG